MSKIKLMSPELANMIAAGEVIERPASVIKELVENSIDANAKNIDIQLYDSGKEMISVKDDGDGMDKDDASLAFKRHASSKLRSLYDLMRITTLGFRGEAVPSIASVSKVHMLTSDGKEGTEIDSVPDSELVIKDAPLRKGTTFEVKELFYNTPARLKYLKGERSENAAAIEISEHLALGFPSVSFNMSIDGRKVFSTNGRGNLLETIAQLYGNDIAKACLPFNVSGDGFTVSGYIAHPSISYSSKYYILSFLNNRSVYIPKVQKAIIDGYKDYLPPVRYPFVCLHITVDYSLVDVNVHPTKKEVRLSCQDELASKIYNGVKTTLLRTRETFSSVKIPEAKPSVVIPQRKDLSNENLVIDDFDKPSIEKKEEPIQENLFASQVQEDKPFIVSDSHGFIEEDKKESVVFEEHISFPTLYPIGQVLKTYIVCDSDDGMYLIDQHAAAERINFEKCEEEFKNNTDRVIPLFPLVVELSPSLKNNFDDDHIYALNKLGIYVSSFGPNSLKADEIPSFLQNKEDSSALNDIITQVLSDSKVDLAAIERLAIATKACKMSIKANNILTHDEQVVLIKTLSKCKNPLNCPHGRPTMIKISEYEIEKLFKRSGF